MGNAMKRTPSMLVPSNASIKSTSSSPPPPATPPPTTPPAAWKTSSDRDSDTASISTSKEKKGSIRSRMGKVMKRTSSMLTPATPRSSNSIDSMDTKIDVSPAVLSPPPTVSAAPLVSPIAESPVIVQPVFASFSSPPPEQAQAVTVSGPSDDLPLPPTDDLASVPATSIATDEPEAMSESDLSPPVQADVIAPETEEVQEPETEKVQPEDIPAAPQMQIERSNSTSSYEVVSAPQEEEVQLSSQEEVQYTHHVDVQSESQNEVSPAAPKEEQAKPDAQEEEEKEQNEPALTAEKVEPTVLEEVPVSTAVEGPPQSQLASHDELNILLPTATDSSLEPPSTHQAPALTDFETDLAEALADEPGPLLPSINGSASHEPVSKAPPIQNEKQPKLEIIHPLSPVFPSHSHPLSISTANSTTTTATTTVTVAAETDPLLPSTQANGAAAYPPGTTKSASAEGTNGNSSKPQAEKPLMDRFIEWLWSWIPWDAVIV